LREPGLPLGYGQGYDATGYGLVRCGGRDRGGDAAPRELAVADDGVGIRATVRTADRTGVEMEALTCVAVAALALVDMVKAVDRHSAGTGVRVVAKSGGRSGDWRE
jgi:hypothetical protein